MRYALITGGLGLIGTFIAKDLLRKRLVDKIVCLDHFGRYSSSLKKNFIDYRKERINYLGKKVIIERGDAKYHSIAIKLLLKYKPIYIFHLAALPLAKLDNLNSEEALEGGNPADDLLNMEGMDRHLAFVLASKGIVTMENLAEQAVEDILGIEDLDAERAGELIMTARAPWFADEEK